MKIEISITELQELYKILKKIENQINEKYHIENSNFIKGNNNSISISNSQNNNKKEQSK